MTCRSHLAGIPHGRVALCLLWPELASSRLYTNTLLILRPDVSQATGYPSRWATSTTPFQMRRSGNGCWTRRYSGWLQHRCLQKGIQTALRKVILLTACWIAPSGTRMKVPDRLPVAHIDMRLHASPTGRPTFNLVGNNSCWYTDMTGSGNETLSHLYEPGNGRITVMFSACQSAPFLAPRQRSSRA